MKPSKRLAAGMAVALLAGSAVSLFTSSSAQAAPISVRCISANGVSPAANETVDLTTTASPASPSVGAAVTVSVVNTTPYLLASGAPAIAAGSERVVVNVTVGPTNYFITGPVNTLTANVAGDPIYNGWTVSGVVNATAPASGPPGTAQTVVLTEFYYDSIASTQMFTPATPDNTVTTSTNNPAPGAWVVTNRAGIVGPNTNGVPSGFDIVCNGSSSGDPRLAVTNTAASTIINVIGPNANIATVSGQNAGVQAVRPPLPSITGYVENPTNITLNGSVWANSVVSGGFTAQFCDVTGVTCDTPIGGTVTNTLTTDGSGNINGGAVVLTRSSFSPFLTTGSRAIKLTQGANTALVPVLVLGTPTITISPASGGPGTAVSASGSNYNPGQPVVARGGAGTAYGTTSLTWVVSADAASAASNAATNGNVGPISFTVNDVATNAILLLQNNTSGTYAASSAGTNRANTTFTVNQDRCIAWNDNVTAGSCNTKQNVNVSVLQGRLTQRAYTNITPTVGSSNSAATSPIAGTSNVNSDPTTVNLGTIISPLAPATIVGNLNDITVSDNRGGTNGWTLSAVMTNFTGVPSGTLANGQLSASPTCVPATNATAWDYNAVGQTAIAGFDDTLNAPGQSAGAASQAFSGTVNLCTKSTAVNAITQTSGGVYNVGAPLTLVVPAFQLAAKYTSTMTITLA